MKCVHRLVIVDRSYFTQYRIDMSLKDYVEKFEFKCILCAQTQFKSVRII